MIRIVDWAVHNTRIVIAMIAVVIVAGISPIRRFPRKPSPTFRSRF